MKKFGPLWATSAFCFESFNGDFVRKITSAKGPIQQITRRFVLQRYAETRVLELNEKRPAVAAIIDHVLGKNKKLPKESKSEDIVRLAKPISSCSDRIINDAIAKNFGPSPQGLKFFMEAIINGTRYHSFNRKKTIRNRSISFKLIDDSDIIPSEEFASACIFFQFGGHLYVVCKKFEIVSRTNLLTVPPPTKPQLLHLFNDRHYGSFFPIVKQTEEFIVVSLDNIICKIILIPYDDAFVVTDVLPFEHN